MELQEAARDRAHASSGGGGSLACDRDRLSALPDCLLHTIMSFMKARQVVQTCVLATRWRHLWRSVPCLNVDLDEFMTAPFDSKWYFSSSFELDNNNGKDREWENFEDFTVNLMHRCTIGLLDSFRLNVRGSRTPMFADRFADGWLRRAMKYCAPDLPIQHEGLSSGSWHLKRLYLRNVALDNRFAKHVSSACHLLEDLELEICTCDIRAITSYSLKNLVLKDCRWHILSKIASPTLKSLVIAGGWHTGDCVLVIVVPVIAHLCLDVPPRKSGRRIYVNQKLYWPRL